VDNWFYRRQLCRVVYNRKDLNFNVEKAKVPARYRDFLDEGPYLDFFFGLQNRTNGYGVGYPTSKTF